MKKIILYISIIFFISCKKTGEFTVDCLSSNLQNGVIAFYPFNNGNIIDESPNNNDLINLTAAKDTYDRVGNPNCAFYFDNSTAKKEYLTTKKSEFLNSLSKLSISLWLYPDDTITSNLGYQILFSRGDSIRCPDRKGEWSVGLYDCNRPVFGHNNSVWSNSLTDFTNGCIGEKKAWAYKWHHLVAVKNNDTYSIFINGILNETDSGNANCGASFSIAKDVGDLIIGKYFNGIIDDIIVYNRALTQQEVKELYNLKPCCQ